MPWGLDITLAYLGKFERSLDDKWVDYLPVEDRVLWLAAPRKILEAGVPTPAVLQRDY